MEGPAWVVGVASTILIGVKLFYQDVLKDYLILRLRIKNELLRGQVDSRTAIDLIEGQYHLFARQLITIAYQVGKAHHQKKLSDDSIAQALRTGMSNFYGKTITSLHSYTFTRNDRRLDLHLRSMTEEQKKLFYAPIIAAIAAFDGDPNDIRNEVLQQIDAFVGEAITLIFEEKNK